MRVVPLVGALMVIPVSVCFAFRGSYLNDYDSTNGTYAPDYYGLGRDHGGNGKAFNRAGGERYDFRNTSSSYYGTSSAADNANSENNKYDFWHKSADAIKEQGVSR